MPKQQKERELEIDFFAKPRYVTMPPNYTALLIPALIILGVLGVCMSKHQQVPPAPLVHIISAPQPTLELSRSAQDFAKDMIAQMEIYQSEKVMHSMNMLAQTQYVELLNNKEVQASRPRHPGFIIFNQAHLRGTIEDYTSVVDRNGQDVYQVHVSYERSWDRGHPVTLTMELVPRAKTWYIESLSWKQTPPYSLENANKLTTQEVGMFQEIKP